MDDLSVSRNKIIVNSTKQQAQEYWSGPLKRILFGLVLFDLDWGVDYFSTEIRICTSKSTNL